MKTLLQQVKKRRLALGLKQNDMMSRIGISRQQYQHLESKGNPRLNTLELIATGLNSEVVLIPKEKLRAVLSILENETTSALSSMKTNPKPQLDDDSSLSEDPWRGLLGDDS